MNLPKTPSLQKVDPEKISTFCKDVIKGLQADQKYLEAKYFYDAKGDALFQEIMNSPSYYLSSCEQEILEDQAEKISAKISNSFPAFTLIELGPGDARKSIHLLRALQRNQAQFNYIPIDISKNVIQKLTDSLAKEFGELPVNGLVGEYLPMLHEVAKQSNLPKVLLFLGSSIGNLDLDNAYSFCQSLGSLLNTKDMLLVGFDLRKKPEIILAAYNDPEGITKAFNLNLLTRINRELDANFDRESFEHFPIYDPQTGICQSFLISKTEQDVLIKQNNVVISFRENEAVFMERSVKYWLEETEKLARLASFSVEHHFFDAKKWFVDSLWVKN